MFAVAFDLHTKEAEQRHPKGVTAAYRDVGRTLEAFGFEWAQGSVYITTHENLANLTAAMVALKALPWFPGTFRDIRAFRVEQWSDFTGFMKGP